MLISQIHLQNSHTFSATWFRDFLMTLANNYIVIYAEATLAKIKRRDFKRPWNTIFMIFQDLNHGLARP